MNSRAEEEVFKARKESVWDLKLLLAGFQKVINILKFFSRNLSRVIICSAVVVGAVNKGCLNFVNLKPHIYFTQRKRLLPLTVMSDFKTIVQI